MATGEGDRLGDCPAQFLFTHPLFYHSISDFPVSQTREATLDYLAFIHREIYYWRFCQKIREFCVWQLRYEEEYARDVDLWVHFALKLANVESFTLDISWNSLVSLTFGYMDFKDGVMEKVLSGCPNLERLSLYSVSGIHPLEISSVKLTELAIDNYYDHNNDLWLEISAPYIQNLRLSGLCREIRIGQGNLASLVTATLTLVYHFEDEQTNMVKETSCLKELLHSVAHVENLKLGHWCIRFIPTLHYLN
ncbi:hypothetical protein HAX54_000341 [Datura stramonium]|uniref:Uncharacterized protein n=1 Tax=Datura stramonium TaxID=4076 RepID=A0ABS8T1V5_DATST|nr:hypothetical protein [Datura stramonium]